MRDNTKMQDAVNAIGRVIADQNAAFATEALGRTLGGCMTFTKDQGTQIAMVNSVLYFALQHQKAAVDAMSANAVVDDAIARHFGGGK